MKTFSTLIALFLLTAAHAQNTESVAFELNTQLEIQSLRLSATTTNSENDEFVPSIGDIQGTTVCLHLNPAEDYELMVNNNRFFTITSEEIRESIQPEEPVSPVILVSNNSFMSEE